MRNGQENQAITWWLEPCTRKEWEEFFPLLVQSEVSLPLVYAGIPTANRPDRSRAAGLLAALAAPTGGVLGDRRAAEARALLAKWCQRASNATLENTEAQQEQSSVRTKSD